MTRRNIFVFSCHVQDGDCNESCDQKGWKRPTFSDLNIPRTDGRTLLIWDVSIEPSSHCRQIWVSSDSPFIPDCTFCLPMLPNDVFIFTFIDLFILEATKTELIRHDQKLVGKAAAPAVLIIAVREVFFFFLDCLCPWLKCNQRVRPCCSQPELLTLMRMLCPGSLARTNTVFKGSHWTHA